MSYIFIHGLGQSPLSWQRLITLCPSLSNVLCPDLFDLINGTEANYQSLYDAFSEYCNNLSEPLNLCGLSLGGVLALNYAVENPEKVQSLVLIGTQYKMPKALLRLQNCVFKIMPRSVFAGMGLARHEVIALTRSMFDLDFSEKLRDISCPTLIACGDKDSANKKAARGLAQGIQGAELRFIANAGHEVNVAQPQELASLLSEFWEKKTRGES
ncbi:MAG: alpha/beta hydrolase [Defluviitaleaceae bacterium]|nr:alpha/beta hydrolase [Defluviitaleaceae bacterium]